MQRVLVLLQKLQELAASAKKLSLIETDLMLDYTRVLYADLLEARSAIVRTSILPTDEPTLDELAAAYEKEEDRQIVPPVLQQSKLPPVGSITSLIGINDKYLLLSSIFANDVRAYDAALRKLSDMSSVHEAISWMNEQGWPKDEIAVGVLKDVVMRYFGN